MHSSEQVSDTVEAWCHELIVTRDLARKLGPPLPPDLLADASWESDPRAALRPDQPGRPPELRVVARSPKTPRRGALARAQVRAGLVHTFLHHELQAAELFAWAVLAYPDAPRAFRAGLVGLCLSELEHLALYRRHLERLGHRVGDFPVRDWFWERIARCPDATAFVALMGLGLEGANLEHSTRFAGWFREAGDEEGARILERVAEEEIAHVAFASTWFERLTGGPLDYERWRATLPPPLTPALLRGLPLNRAARLRAGMDERFLARLAAEPPA